MRSASTGERCGAGRAIGMRVIALLVAGSSSACGLLLGIEPGTLGAAVDAADASHLSDGSVDAGMPEKDQYVPMDVSFVVDSGFVIYVSTVSDAAIDDCGTKSAPCPTITSGLAQVQSGTPTTLEVAGGTYQESLTLQSGVTIRGGFDPSWKESDAGANATIIQGVTNRAVTIQGLSEPVLLANLQIQSTSATSGPSLYGIFIASNTEGITLDGLDITTGNASAGMPGGPGMAGADAPPAGSCNPAGDGEPGVSSPTSSSTFNDTGFVPGDGASGSSGDPGTNGSTGSQDCQSCADTGCFDLHCGSLNNPECAAGGSGGCGSGGGGGGTGGGGGGASIGVFIWNSEVRIDGTTFLIGDGGDGAGGGPGGDAPAGSAPGGAASKGCALAVSNCFHLLCSVTMATTLNGASGTGGGRGGKGAPGGGGAGGDSDCVAWIGGEPVVSGGGCRHGNPGSGGGNGPVGRAGSIVQVEQP